MKQNARIEKKRQNLYRLFQIFSEAAGRMSTLKEACHEADSFEPAEWSERLPSGLGGRAG